MKRSVRWAAIALAVLVGVPLAGAGVALGASEVMIRAPGPRAATQFRASAGPEAIAHGRELAITFGCHDCHGADFRGRLFHDEPPVVTVSGPNLTLAAAQQTDAQLERAIRRGVAADGRALWVMPSEAFSTLTDQETADLIAYLRSFPAGGEPMRIRKVGPIGRVGVLLGKFKSSPANLQAEPDVRPVDLGPQHARGLELARTCMECHGRDLKGAEGALKTPDLMIAGAYDLKDFEHFMRTGKAAGNRELPLMSATSRSRFAKWSAADVAALHSYLKARADAAT